MKSKIYIQNLKCGGCATTIHKSLDALSGVSNVEVNNEDNSVSFDLENDDLMTEVKSTLSRLGYPVIDDPNNLLLKAKSYLSCAIGRVENIMEN